MKKILFAILIFSAFAISSNAQNTKFFRFGLHANTGITWVKPDVTNLKYDGMKFGVGWGFIGEMTIADNFSFASGFDVNYMGGKISEKDINKKDTLVDPTRTIASISSNYRYQFLDIPLTLKMKTNEINYITYFARIGGSVGISFKAMENRRYEFTDNTNNVQDDINLNKERRLFRANFIVGGGVEYSLGGTTTALAEISFVNGLTTVVKDVKARGNYVMLKFGVIF